MRLYEISYNEEQWSIKECRDGGYNIVNKSTYDSFHINDDVIGIEQISDYIFLIHRQVMRDEWQIYRLNLTDGQYNVDFLHNFNDYFCFLTEDLIIFDYESSTDCTVYSISQNKRIDDLNHLISQTPKRHDSSYVSDRTITLLYETEDSDYPIYLSVDYTLHHTSITNEHLQVILDPSSFKPVTPVYSTLRDKYITLSDSVTLNQLVEEENHYLYIIHDFLYNLYGRDNTKSEEELLSMIEDSNH